MAGRIRIGEILLRAGVIDDDQLSAALGEQRRWGRPLGATLVKMGFLDERALVRALASQLALPVASLEGKRIAPEVLALVPADIAEQCLVLPLFVKTAGNRTTLYLAMEDPCDLAVLDDLAFRTGLQVKPVMMSPSELAEGIDRYYREVRGTPPAAPATPAPAAEAEIPSVGEVALDALDEETRPTPDAGASEPAAPAPPAAAGEGGTAELVRHFSGGDAGAAPPPADPATASAPASSTPAPAETPAPAPTATPGAPAPSFDESALSSPPPRTAPANESRAPSLPPVESLASYEAKTRTILHVLTQLLIEKGVISRDEFHARVSALASVEHGGPQDAD